MNTIWNMQEVLPMIDTVQVQPQIRATIEVTYSGMRKQEMASNSETNCSLLIKRLKEVLEFHGATNIEISLPKGKTRYTDIIYEFNIQSADILELIKNEIKDVGGENIERISVFVEENTI